MSDDDICCVKTNQPASWREREYQGISRVAVFNSMVSKGLSGRVTVERGSRGEPRGGGDGRACIQVQGTASTRVLRRTPDLGICVVRAEGAEGREL